MGSLVSLLVLGAIYSIVYVVKNLTSAPAEGKKIFGEGFPEVEVLEPQPEFVAPAPQATSGKRFSKPKQQPCGKGEKGAAKPLPQPQPVRPVVEEKCAPEKSEAAADGRLVRLNSKSEAKRAFIYSEIFNRKY